MCQDVTQGVFSLSGREDNMTNMIQKSKVKYDDLEYLPEGVFLFDSRPFTGVAIDRNNSGAIISEVPFVDGRQHGLARTWHANGRPSLERPYVHGESHGLAHEWFEDGSLKSETVFEFGTMMKRELRDRTGTLVEMFIRPSSDQLYQNVLKRRAQG